ncbi:NAD-dependent epimerase/dehydratase family protein [Stappia sp.]|uniref:NAD-dependent epimerase/dehydratase family protein n=1 Tax=Stappia sp. TaxID=1870903 RepID=UPI003A99B034
MNIFLTGGSGTIGRAVLSSLIGRGNRVTALARSDRSAALLREAGARVVRGDVGKLAEWLDTALAGDALIHLASSFDADAQTAEAALVEALARAVPGRKTPFRLVHTGGIWLYPENLPAPLDETVPYAPIPAFTHVAAAIRKLEAVDGLSLAVVHPALVCAPDSGPVADMARAADSGEPFATRARAGTLWPLVEAGDLADLYRLAVESDRRVEVIGCGIEAVAAGDLAALVARRKGADIRLEQEPAAADAPPDLDIAAGYALSQRASGETARRLLGWQPRFTDAESLVAALVAAPS